MLSCKLYPLYHLRVPPGPNVRNILPVTVIRLKLQVGSPPSSYPLFTTTYDLIGPSHERDSHHGSPHPVTSIDTSAFSGIAFEEVSEEDDSSGSEYYESDSEDEV